MITTTTMI